MNETPLIEEPEPLVMEPEPLVEAEEKKSFWARFLEFLKWFASKYWWLLLLLLLIILFLFFTNSPCTFRPLKVLLRYFGNSLPLTFIFGIDTTM